MCRRGDCSEPGPEEQVRMTSEPAPSSKVFSRKRLVRPPSGPRGCPRRGKEMAVGKEVAQIALPFLKISSVRGGFQSSGSGAAKIECGAAAAFRTLGKTRIIYQTIIDTRE